jgi:hypothetical protein
MTVPLYVDRNLALGVIALVAMLTFMARRGLKSLWIVAVFLAVAALALSAVLDTVPVWWNGCRPLCGEGWDVPGTLAAGVVLGAAGLLSIYRLGSRQVPIWLRSASAAVLLWIVLRANLSTWVS